MPARDLHHLRVRHAREKDGWRITHDPLRLRYGGRDLFVDLGAEHLIGAEKAARRIAVEVKTFLGASPIADLEQAVGQFILYEDVLEKTEPERTLFLAVSNETWTEVFEEPVGQLVLARMRLLVFEPNSEDIQRWTPEPPIVK